MHSTPATSSFRPDRASQSDAGISKEVIRQLGTGEKRRPVLGVCLGHQCIGEVFGGKVVRAPRLMHGKTSPVYHYGERSLSGRAQPI